MEVYIIIMNNEVESEGEYPWTAGVFKTYKGAIKHLTNKGFYTHYSNSFNYITFKDGIVTAEIQKWDVNDLVDLVDWGKVK